MRCIRYRLLGKNNLLGENIKKDLQLPVTGQKTKERENLSLIKVNISRIDSKEEYPSSVKMNISRIYCRGKVGIISINYWIEY